METPSYQQQSIICHYTILKTMVSSHGLPQSPQIDTTIKETSFSEVGWSDLHNITCNS